MTKQSAASLIHLTFLAFQLNAELDAGRHLDVSAVHTNIAQGTLFSWLKSEFPRMDLSIFYEDVQQEIGEALERLDNAVDAWRKYGVKRNGLSLLVGHMLELIQNGPWLRKK